MNDEAYIKKKLFQNKKLKHFLDYMKDSKQGCYVAGGAITSIATGNHDKIEDYDLYFTDKNSCVEAIRYMKEENPHVAFVSDKSITYVMDSETKIQFIYYDFYPYFENVFNHFDFTINMGVYQANTDKVIVDHRFWMHNAQRYLEINPKTKFPILTMLRLDKYKKRGYKTSRKEILKLGLAISGLSINSWEDFKTQIGNQYGLDLADVTDTEGEDFTLEKGMERLLEVEFDPDNPTPHQNQYLHDIHILDFIVDGEPLKYCIVNDKTCWLDEEAAEYSDAIETAIEKETLSKVEVPMDEIIADKYYYIRDEEGLDIKKSGHGYNIYTKDNISIGSWDLNRKVIVDVKGFDQCKILDASKGSLCVEDVEFGDVVCRAVDLNKFKKGEEVSYIPKANNLKQQSFTHKGYAFNNNIEEIKGRIKTIQEFRKEHLTKYVVVTSKNPHYAHNRFQGYILEGGEDIQAEELLYFLDDWNLCFGGNITISSNGSFSGRYNTD